MTIQIKKDIRTIVEILAYLIVSFSIGNIYYTYPWLGWTLFAIGVGSVVYRNYFMRYRSDTILFPTQNDDAGKMSYLAFGIMVIFFAGVAYFAFNVGIYRMVIGLTIGIGVILFGLFQSPKGWLVVKNNLLEIYGITGTTDIRQLKEIALHNDKIILTNIYDEHTSSTLLRLDPPASGHIKIFLEKTLGQNKILVIDNVTVVA